VAPWPRSWGPFVLVDAILTPTREPSLLSSQIQQGPGHLPWLRGLDLNQRPLGYEPFSKSGLEPIQHKQRLVN